MKVDIENGKAIIRDIKQEFTMENEDESLEVLPSGAGFRIQYHGIDLVFCNKRVYEVNKDNMEKAVNQLRYP